MTRCCAASSSPRSGRSAGNPAERDYLNDRSSTMKTSQVAHALDYDRLDDHGLVELARSGDTAVFRTIMQRHNRRLYRVARGILGDDAEAEDVVQEAYVRAFENLAQFR